MFDNKRFKAIHRLMNYINTLVLQNKYKVDFSISNNHILVMVNDDDYTLKYESVINDFDKMEEDILIEKIDNICDNLHKFRIDL